MPLSSPSDQIAAVAAMSSVVATQTNLPALIAFFFMSFMFRNLMSMSYSFNVACKVSEYAITDYMFAMLIMLANTPAAVTLAPAP